MYNRPQSPSNEQKLEAWTRHLGTLLILSSPLWVWALFFSWEYDAASDLLIVPVVAVVNVTLLVVVCRRDLFLRNVMVVGLIMKVAAAGAVMYVAFVVYGAAADLAHYLSAGKAYAELSISPGELLRQSQDPAGTVIVTLMTSMLFRVIGPSLASAMAAFAMLSLWGQYLYYRAFCVVYPQGDRRLAAVLLFFLPSIVFWTAGVGKDAPVMFFSGLVAYGLGRIIERAHPLHYAQLVGGLAGVAAFRPHIAALLALAACAAYVFGKHRSGLSGMAVRTVGIPLVLGVCGYLLVEAKAFVDLTDFSNAAAVFARVGADNAFGGSAFATHESVTARVLQAPFLLFRPFPWEVHNLQAGLASFEAVALLLFFWQRRDGILRALRQWKANAFLIFSLVYFVAFSIVFAASITNFGLLVRQRVMLLPLVIMLVCSQRVPQTAWLPVLRRRPGPLRARPSFRSPVGAG